METLRLFAREVAQVSDAALILSISTLTLVGLILICYWFYNRKKFQKLTHQIPASVVKNYLDSIIQNSNSLKSSLFRGGGLDLDAIPSVLPTSDLPSGGVSAEDINQKNAEISSLQRTIEEKQKVISELEAKVSSGAAPAEGGNDEELLKKIADLEAQLAAAPAGEGGGDDGKLTEVTKERDELKERLMEYEIIEEDLANLKKLQIENESLKKQLAGGEAPAEEAPAEEPTPIPEAEPVEEEAAAPVEEPPAEEEPAPEPEAAAPAPDPEPVQEPEGEPEEEPEQEEVPQKSAEELLSEFEKMLG